jgi:hypothetical protein
MNGMFLGAQIEVYNLFQICEMLVLDYRILYVQAPCRCMAICCTM